MVQRREQKKCVVHKPIIIFRSYPNLLPMAEKDIS